MIERIEAYCDAIPLTGARAEESGPFTLFVPDSAPWPYYARPTLRTEHEFEAGDVEAVLVRQRALGVPEALEWIDDVTPSLLPAARAAGLEVLLAPLLVLERPIEAEPPAGVTVRLLEPDDPGLALALAVPQVAFAAAGTRRGDEGTGERDAAAAAISQDHLDAVSDRMRRGVTVMVAAGGEEGPLAVGTHQPLGDVTEVVGIGTLPSARRRGLGAAVTAALVRDASAEIVFLTAGSEEIARVYERVGFARIGTGCIAAPAEG